jgi:AcrR family transcriptional regulator
VREKKRDPQTRATRADALENQRRLVDATVELVLEIGGEPSRDAIAKRAGVGIATLYRHFPSRQDMLRASAIDVLDRTIAAGEAALAEAVNGAALRQYLHATIDIGLGAVNIVYPLLDDTDWPEQRRAAQRIIDRLIDVARRDGEIGDDVAASDIVFASIRFGRPLSIGLDRTDERSIAHRQLDRYLDGLAMAADVQGS